MRLLEHPEHVLLVMGVGNQQEIYRLLIKWLKKKASEFLSSRLQKISQETGLIYNKVTIKNQKTIWGSCTANKNINLSISLLFLPPSIVNYILIHELCHTVYLNHSLHFWKLVSQFVSDYKNLASESRKAMCYVPFYFQQ